MCVCTFDLVCYCYILLKLVFILLYYFIRSLSLRFLFDSLIRLPPLLYLSSRCLLILYIYIPLYLHDCSYSNFSSRNAHTLDLNPSCPILSRSLLILLLFFLI